jgi:hypothetical protein
LSSVIKRWIAIFIGRTPTETAIDSAGIEAIEGIGSIASIIRGIIFGGRILNGGIIGMSVIG